MIINTVGGGSGGGAVAVIEVSVTLSAGSGDVSGISVSATAPGQATLTGITDSSGNVQLTGAIAGATYTVTGTKSDYSVSTDTVKIEHLLSSVSLTAMKSATVTITVTDAQSGSVSGLTVIGTGAASVSAVTNSSGVATFNLSTAGEYSFTLASGSIPTGGTASTYSVTVAAGTDYTGTIAITYKYGYAAVDIAINTSDPNTRCSYPQTITVNGSTVNNSCYGYTPMAGSTSGTFTNGSWAGHKILEGIKPVSFDGNTWIDLGTDASQWANNFEGTDYFTEFPFQWLSITNDGTRIRVIFSDNDTRPDSTFQCNAHVKGCDGVSNSTIESAMSSASRDSIMGGTSNTYFANAFHEGCFAASGSTSGIYSRKGQSNLVNMALNKYWVAANKRGVNYDCMSYQQWTYLQALFVLLFKSTNCQAAHSSGYVGGSAVQSSTGLATNVYGMAGTVGGTTTQMAFFWLHNLWGNMYQFIASLYIRAGSTKLMYYYLPRMAQSAAWDNSSWNSTSNYAKQSSLGTSTGSTTSANGGYIKTVAGTNAAGFAPMETSGSETTYFADRGGSSSNTSSACFPYVGGYYYDSGYAGFFRCYVGSTSADSTSTCGARLAYRGGH